MKKWSERSRIGKAVILAVSVVVGLIALLYLYLLVTA